MNKNTKANKQMKILNQQTNKQKIKANKSSLKPTQ